MALAKLAEDIAIRNAENGARVVYPSQYPPTHRPAPDPFHFTPEAIEAIRKFVREANARCEARLSREMVLVYEHNAAKTEASSVGFMTKGEAAKIAGGTPIAARICESYLLDIDDLYGGMLIHAGYLFVSDRKLIDGYGSSATLAALTDGVLKEKLAA
jgi:hypothetical protein